MVLGGTETKKVVEVFLVVQSHADVEFFKYLGEELSRNQVVPPVVDLPFALEAETVQGLWLDLVALKQLEHSSEEVFGVSWVPVDAPTQPIQDNVLLLCGHLQVANEGLQL